MGKYYQPETIANDFKYAGEAYDSETGFYYLRARYYDPTVGRFISQDSNEGQITNPLSLNLYTYCVNNPIKYVDPSGNVPVIPILIAVGVYLGETAIETAPDYGLAVAANKLTGEKTNHVATFAEEYVWNLVPGAGEIRTGKQVTGFAVAGIKYGTDSAKAAKKGAG